MSVDEKSPLDYVTLDDPVCSTEDGCGGSGRIGQGFCPKCGGVGRRITEEGAARRMRERYGDPPKNVSPQTDPPKTESPQAP